MNVYLGITKSLFDENWKKYIDENKKFKGNLYNDKFNLTFIKNKKSPLNYSNLTLIGTIEEKENSISIDFEYTYNQKLKIAVNILLLLIGLYLLMNINFLLMNSLILLTILLLFGVDDIYIVESKKYLLDYVINNICEANFSEEDIEKFLKNPNKRKRMTKSTMMVLSVFVIIANIVGIGKSFLGMNIDDFSIVNNSYSLSIANRLEVTDQNIYIGSDYWVQIFDKKGNFIKTIYYGDLKSKSGVSFMVRNGDLYIIEELYEDQDNDIYKQVIYKVDLEKEKLSVYDESTYSEKDYEKYSLIYRQEGFSILDFKFRKFEIEDVTYKLVYNTLYTSDGQKIKLNVSIFNLNTMQYGLIAVTFVMILSRLSNSAKYDIE
ncbi:hypothetical protein [Intestinibacter sp.]|uniref:hypothetical protein n=1 Tax=Intestinibacter sp. TaxID=1965304 RepID=UPI002A7480A0|nr:hypothetical protein [Intestinibacter sp.]MDY2738038.1 hypothetical protein [Intestinibacter sp.]